MSNKLTIPVLETGRLVLREPTINDTQAIFRNFSDDQVAGWFFNEPFTDPSEAEAIILTFRTKNSKQTGITWAIYFKEGQEVVGTVGFEGFTPDGRGEIGFDLARDHWGKGLMSEALRAIIQYGFKTLGLREIFALTYHNNKRSIVLLERLGFIKTGDSEDSGIYTLGKDSQFSHQQSLEA